MRCVVVDIFRLWSVPVALVALILLACVSDAMGQDAVSSRLVAVETRLGLHTATTHPSERATVVRNENRLDHLETQVVEVRERLAYYVGAAVVGGGAMGGIPSALLWRRRREDDNAEEED